MRAAAWFEDLLPQRGELVELPGLPDRHRRVWEAERALWALSRPIALAVAKDLLLNAGRRPGFGIASAQAGVIDAVKAAYSQLPAGEARKQIAFAVVQAVRLAPQGIEERIDIFEQAVLFDLPEPIRHRAWTPTMLRGGAD